MKKLIAILMVLLCAFSLSADWGRIRYVDEFGDTDPDDSDPYQIADGTRYEYGVTDYDYRFRLLTVIPSRDDANALIGIDMFDDYGNQVVFRDGGEAVIRVKLASDEIVESSYPFAEYEEEMYLYGNEAVRLMNELYKGNDLKFVIYYDDVRYNFSIDAEGYKETADEFITSDYMLYEEPETFIERDAEGNIFIFASLQTIIKNDDGKDYSLFLYSFGAPDYLDMPCFALGLAFKGSDDIFWYSKTPEQAYKDVRLISEDGDELSLVAAIFDDENGSHFILQESSLINEIIEFANTHDGISLIVEFTDEIEFNIHVTPENIINAFRFPE